MRHAAAKCSVDESTVRVPGVLQRLPKRVKNLNIRVKGCHVGIWVRFAFFAVAVLCASPSFAQGTSPAPAPKATAPSSNAPQPVVTQFTPDEVASILRDAGYRAEIVHEDNKYHILTGMGGYKVILYLYCDGTKCTSLDWDVSFSAASKFTLTLANKWNREKRYAKAYIATDGAFFLEYSLDFTGGVTRQTITASSNLFERFVTGLDAWIDSSSH